MIHPRRLKGTAANIARYYTVGDYYTKGSDEHSEWGGAIARDLGLEGKVDPALFKALLAGEVSDQQLGRRRRDGTVEHHPGWDFAVNAPKSVSVMALVIGDERISEAHERAVGTALAYLEEHAALRRRIDGEIVQETTGRLVFARFTEHASRELDPHLHTHVVVMNITNDGPDARMSSLETRAMFAEQIVAGQIYRNDLAHRLRELGYGIEYDPRSGLFEIRDVPRDLLREFSQRAEQIDAHASEHGLTGQAARVKSYYATRRPKAKASLDDLREGWTARAAPYRDALEAAREGAQRERPIEVEPATAARAMLFGIRQAETGEAVNNLGHILRFALAAHVGEVRLADVRPRAEEHEERRKLLSTGHETGDLVLTRGRTTRRTARLELALSEHLSLALGDAAPIASPDRLQEVLSSAGLNPEQEAALLFAGTSSDRLIGIHGVAGAGKSTLVKALKDASPAGLTFIALAPTSSAAGSLGARAEVESRTVASLVAGGGRGLDESHVLVLDEAGQLGNRQALRVLEISHMRGARLILVGDNKQTGAIEQGKTFWLLQRLGLPTAQLTDAVRQERGRIKAAVAQARLGNYAASLENLDKVTSGEGADQLARGLVAEWARLSPESRDGTNILVLDNATRLIVNSKIREALKAEGAIAAEDARLSILAPAGMSNEEKRMARFYSGGQVLVFSRDNGGLGIARDTEYRVVGTGRDETGRQIVRLVDENGRTIRWDPRIGRVSHVNVFKSEERALAAGDRIQWRLVSYELGLRNAERGTVESLEGAMATIRWDRGERTQDIDLSRHKNWDHGYAETVYSAQSKTYDRVYVLAPVNSGLVTGQNYYTAITRARFGAKLWTEDPRRLAEKLERRSGEKTSALEGLGRLGRDSHTARADRHGERWDRLREEQRAVRQQRKDRLSAERETMARAGQRGLGERLASRAQASVAAIERWIGSVFPERSAQDRPGRGADAERPTTRAPATRKQTVEKTRPAQERGHDR